MVEEHTIIAGGNGIIPFVMHITSGGEWENENYILF